MNVKEKYVVVLYLIQIVQFNLICLSDDSGLEVDLLDGAPGIYSSRWAGGKKNFNSAA